MALRNPLDVLGFGAPRQGGFGGPAVPMAPPMPGPGFAPVTGPGGSGNVLPARYGRLDRFQQNHPRAAGFLADNSSALLHFGLGLLSGGGVPSRSWAGAQQGLAYGGSVDRERASTRKAEDEEAARNAEWEALLAELPMGDDERRVLQMVGPDAGAEAVFTMLTAQEEAPESTDDIREYEFYAAQERAAGREPAPFSEWFSMTTRPTTNIQNNVGANGIQLPEPPSGYDYRRNADGTPIIGPDGVGELTRIPGGPEAAEAEAAEAAGEAREERRDQLAGVAVDDIDRSIEILERNPGWTTGIGGWLAAQFPGTERQDLEGAIDTIKAQIGFNQLQAMREASPTGGALGQVAVQEINYLQSVLGSLSLEQGSEVLLYNLRRIRETLARIDSIIGGGTGEPATSEEPAEGDDGWTVIDGVRIREVQ